jgi:anti-sigma regulatory factor (Ser/Thr protein kinase)
MSTLHLEPTVASTPLARHWVAARLRGLPDEIAGCAALLTSELVTNAVLHAATPMSVTLHVLPGRIRIDVADGDPTFPAMKEYSRDAATGRGLTLFNALAADWGVLPVEGGKIVWFELPVDHPVAPTSVSDGSFRFDLTGLMTPPYGRDEGSPEVPVRLLGVPVHLVKTAGQEYEALFRELRLMKERSEATSDAPALPERLSALVAGTGAGFKALGPGMDEVWQRAVDREVETFDWALKVPRSALAACELYDTLLDEAAEFGIAQRLLTLPASPASVAVRRWFLSELIRQLHGEPAVAWADSRFHHGLNSTPAR